MDATGPCSVLEQPRPVQDLHEGWWMNGSLTAQRREPDGWWGMVEYSPSVVSDTITGGRRASCVDRCRQRSSLGPRRPVKCLSIRQVGMLNCLAASIPGCERVVSCEEVFELRFAHPDRVALQTRQAGLEGAREIRLRHLLKESLRMRPSPLVIGEVRAEECLVLLLP